MTLMLNVGDDFNVAVVAASPYGATQKNLSLVTWYEWTTENLLRRNSSGNGLFLPLRDGILSQICSITYLMSKIWPPSSS
jgi:hypothetical protein